MPATDKLTRHATMRSHARSIPHRQINLALDWGREVNVRGAWIYAIGRREVARARRHGVDLRSAEGVHVVCSSDGAVITVYRNRSLKGLRPRHRHAA